MLLIMKLLLHSGWDQICIPLVLFVLLFSWFPFFFSSSFQFQICRIMQFLKTHMDVVQIPGSRAHGEGFGVLAGLTRSGTRGFVSD